jgi:hypothetical protein
MKSSSTEHSNLSVERRELLKTGFWGGMFLASVSLGASLTGCATTPAGMNTQPPTQRTAYHYRFLSADDLSLLTAITPVLIWQQSAKTTLSTDKLLNDIDTAIFFFSHANQQEVRKLFDLLNFAPTRALLGGVWSSWENASTEDIEDFLNDWKYSSLPLLNQAYSALVKIVSVSWYIQPENWQASGYSGPPEAAVKALPQFS